ncbi:MAG: hypothetical protein ABFC77_12295 [Thermoguttaceae bacterium]
MKTARALLLAYLTLGGLSTAWAQYGLYGSPETLSPSSSVAAYPTVNAPAASYTTTSGYPSTATPVYQPYSGVPVYQVAPTYQATPGYQGRAAGYPPTYQAAAPSYPTLPSRSVQPPYRPIASASQPAYQPYQAPSYPASSPSSYGYNNGYNRSQVRMASTEPIPAPQEMPIAPVPNDNPMTPYAASPMAPMSPSPRMNPAPQPNGYGSPASQSPCNGAYRGTVNSFEQAACGPCSSGCDNLCGPGCYCPWYAGVSALALTRLDGRRIWTAYDDHDETHQLGPSQFPMSWEFGGEVRFGRRFCGCDCTPWALEARYWTFNAFSGNQDIEASDLPAGHTINSIFGLNYLNFNGEGYEHWFYGADAITLKRRNECHNVEINLVREQLAVACNSPWDIGWLVGVRYFRFDEELTYGSLAGGYDRNNPANWAYIGDDVTNNLIGVQVGFDIAYNVCEKVRIFLSPEVGVYDNYIQGRFRVETGDGIPGGSVFYGDYPVSSNRNGLAMLAQIDLGVEWQFARNWSFRGGYRIVGVTGVALADDQFPQYIVDKPEVENIQHYDSLVLHGAFFGLTYNF